MAGMKAGLLAAAVLAGALTGCLCREGNGYNVGDFPHQWSIPGPETEVKAFGPVPVDELKDFVREKESEGWEVIGLVAASLPEDIMVNSVELDRPAPPKREWTFDIPRTMDDRVEAPRKPSIPPYVDTDVKAHRQKYVVNMRRWR
jgi:hypothetical protein